MRRKIKRRIVWVSLLAGLVTVLVAASGVLFFEILLPSRDLAQTNRETLNRIRCESVQKLSYTGESRLCDVTTIHNDAELDSSDFVLTKDTYFVLLASADLPRLPLATVDLAFIRQFRQPTRVEMPDGSVWRLYSHPSEIKGHAVEVFVGHLEMAPWTHVKVPATPEIDQLLKEEAVRLLGALHIEGSVIRAGRLRTTLDTFTIVDGVSGRVSKWDNDVPLKLQFARPPEAGLSRSQDDSRLYLVTTDGNEGLIAISVHEIGDLWWLAAYIVAAFVVGALLVYIALISSPRLRAIIRPKEGAHVTLEEARKTGEGRGVEFKREFTTDSILKAIAAFANSGDGTIFIGIDDHGKIVGLPLETLEARGKFRERILNAIRSRIKPLVDVYIDFESVEGALVAKVFVSRGEERLYYLDGRVYERVENENVIAEPDRIQRLIEQFA